MNNTPGLHHFLQLVRVLIALGNLGKNDNLAIRDTNNIMVCYSYLGLVWGTRNWMDMHTFGTNREIVVYHRW